MKIKLGLAAAALAVAMLAIPVSAEAHFDRGVHKNWRCHWFGWLDHSRCKVAKKYYKKRVRKAMK